MLFGLQQAAWLFLSQVAVFVIFILFEKWARRKDAAHTSQRRVVEKKKNDDIVQEDEAAAVSPSLKDLDPIFLQLIELRDVLKRTDSPDTFVEHARAGRRLISIERTWNKTFEKMSLEEKKPYIQVLKKRGEATHSERVLSAQETTSSSSSPRQLQFQSAFAEVMRDDLSEDKRNELYENLAKSFFQGGGLLGNGLNRQGELNQNFKLTRLVAPLKLAASWVVLHCIAGYATRLSRMPMFSLPASGVWPVVGSGGGIHFPASLFLSEVPLDTVYDAVLEQSVVGSRTALFSAPKECQLFVSFGWMGTAFIIARGLTHVIKQFISKDGCIPKAMRSIRTLTTLSSWY